MLKSFRYLLLATAFSVSSISFISAQNAFGYSNNSKPPREGITCRQLYEEIKLNDIVDYNAFEQAIIGQSKVDVPNKDIITLIDFSRPSDQDRLFVIDLKHRKLLFSSVVAHGKKSGDKYATSFSNANGSNKSSMGFFVTEETYKGRNGYSLRLNGLEKNINDNARERAIVIHGANYANPMIARSSGRLGRSLGCPAVPRELNKPIIDTIKDGTLIYIYTGDNKYLSKSSILSDYTYTQRYGIS